METQGVPIVRLEEILTFPQISVFQSVVEKYLY